MSILESVAQTLGIEINKQFKVYDDQGTYVAAAVFKLDNNGECQLLVTPKSTICINTDTVLGGLITGNLIPQTKKLEPCPFCGGRKALVQRMRFTRGGQIQIMYTVYCPDCQAHGPFTESEDAAADGWNGDGTTGNTSLRPSSWPSTGQNISLSTTGRGSLKKKPRKRCMTA